MIKSAVNEQEELAGIRKAAILMVMIGDEASGHIMRELSETEVQDISKEIARLHSTPPETSEKVLEEFYQMSIAQDFVVQGGVDYARKMLVSAFGNEYARKMLDRLMKSIGNETLSFDALQKTDPQQLAKFIHSEHPQTIALVLSHLSPTQAASLLSSLPHEIRHDVALRMANLDQISPEIVSKIATVIGGKLKSLEIGRAHV